MPEKTPNIPSEPSETELEKEQKFREAKIERQREIERAVRSGDMPFAEAPETREELEKQVRESLVAEEKAQRERSEKQPVVRHDEPIHYPEMFSPKAKPPKTEKPKSEKPRAEIKSEPVLEELEELVIEKEAPKVEFKKMAVSEELGIEKAMKEPGAFEFLTKYAGDVEKLSKEEIRYLLEEAFPTSKLVKGFYRGEVAKDIGLELKDEDLDKPLDAYFATTAFVNMKYIDPKFAESIRANIQEFRELPQRISDKESQLETLNKVFGPQLPIEKMSGYLEKARTKLGNLGIELGQMERKREISKTMHGIQGFFNWRNSGIIQFLLGGAELGRKAVAGATEVAGKRIEGAKIKRLYEEIGGAKEAKSKTVDQWRLRVGLLSRRIDKLTKETLAAEKIKKELPKAQEELEELKEKAAALKNFFFNGYFEPATNIIKIAKDKLREKFNSIANPQKTNIKILEKGLEELPKFGKAEIVNLGKGELGEFEKKFDDLIEQRANRDILARLKKLTLNKVNPLKSIEKEVDVYLKREKLGKRGKKEIEETVVKILTNYIKRTEPPTGEKPESFKAKKIAARCFLIKLGYA